MSVESTDADIKPLLTIAVPTYNRASYLDLSLGRIFEEIGLLNKDQRYLVCVRISNNASTDETDQVIAKYLLLGDVGFEVIHNKENIGGERNVVQCFVNATTPYVWILGDDDVILHRGLKMVLDILQGQNPDIVYVGNYHFIENYLDASCAVQIKKHGTLILNNAEMFVRRTNVMLTFVSALIVRSKHYLDYQPEAAAGSNLPQLGWVLPLLRDGDKFVIVEDWVVAAKGANSGGYGLIKVFGENLLDVTGKILGYQSKLQRVIASGTIINFFPGFVLEIRRGVSNFDCVDMESGLKKAFSGNWRYYIFLVPLIKLPLFLAYRYNSMLNMLRRKVGKWLI